MSTRMKLYGSQIICKYIIPLDDEMRRWSTRTPIHLPPQSYRWVLLLSQSEWLVSSGNYSLLLGYVVEKLHSLVYSIARLYILRSYLVEELASMMHISPNKEHSDVEWRTITGYKSEVSSWHTAHPGIPWRIRRRHLQLWVRRLQGTSIEAHRWSCGCMRAPSETRGRGWPSRTYTLWNFKKVDRLVSNSTEPSIRPWNKILWIWESQWGDIPSRLKFPRMFSSR